MPKLFDLNLKVEEVALGRVMRLLHSTAGVAKVDFDLGDAPTAKSVKSNGAGHEEDKPRKTRKTRFVDPNGVTGVDVLIKALFKSRKPLRPAEIRNAFLATGRAGTSANSLLHNLAKDGVVQNKGDGYLLTKKGRDRARYVK